MKHELVPFGKYKGQPIEVLAQDKQYCEWLASQDWFRDRFSGIHTLIINNFGAPAETPDHNALQVLFTRHEWVAQFINAYLGRRNERWWEDLTAACTASAKTALLEESKRLDDSEQRYRDYLRLNPQNRWQLAELDEIIQRRAAMKTKAAAYVKWAEQLWLRITSSVEFEDKGADVVVSATAGERIPPECDFSSSIRPPRITVSLRIECKPVMGDDYPAVLRQMRANQCTLLLLGRGGYTGVGATFEQVKQVFETSGIAILELENVENAAPFFFEKEQPQHDAAHGE